MLWQVFYSTLALVLAYLEMMELIFKKKTAFQCAPLFCLKLKTIDWIKERVRNCNKKGSK